MLRGDPRRHRKGVGRWDREGMEATKGYHSGQLEHRPAGGPLRDW